MWKISKLDVSIESVSIGLCFWLRKRPQKCKCALFVCLIPHIMLYPVPEVYKVSHWIPNWIEWKKGVIVIGDLRNVKLFFWSNFFFGTKSLEMIVLFGPNNSRLAIWTHSFVIQKILSLRVLKLRVLCGDRWKLILVRAPDIFRNIQHRFVLGWASSHFNDIRLWWFVNFTASKWWLMTSDYKLSAMQASRRGWWKLSSSILRSPR